MMGSEPREPRERQWTSFCTLPALMQPVQTWSRLGAPFTSARTRWMFGFHRRLVRRCEWLTLMPHDGCLPHTSQTAAIDSYLMLVSTKNLRTLLTRHQPQQPGQPARRPVVIG